MTILCAWCDKEMGTKKGKGVTHSICDDCIETFEKEMEKNNIKDEHKNEIKSVNRRIN